MRNNNAIKWLNVIAYLAMIAINILANTTILGGRRTNEVSDMYPTLLTPAGYAFSIWSVIYILLAGFIIYQFRSQTASRDSVQRIGIWFAISCLLNLSWLLLWQYLYIELSVVVMVLLLITLIVIYLRTRRITNPTTGEKWLVKLPFSIYLGWISVATILNVAISLRKNEWNGFGLSDASWAVIMLCVGGLIAVLVSYLHRDYVYPLVFVWAYIAIAIKQQDTKQVMMTALIAAGILFIHAIWLFITRRRARD